MPAGFTTWLVDFEFSQPVGEFPSPICLVAQELSSGERIEMFGDQLHARRRSPYPVDSSALFVAYSATAELSCHLALGWRLPERVLDLYAEFRNLTNGLYLPSGSGIVGASAYFGLSPIDAERKELMRDLAIRGGPFNAEERVALLSYCAGDVVALSRLYQAMNEQIDMPRALLRGRYIRALTQVETGGLPIDTVNLDLLRGGWGGIRQRLIDEVDAPLGFFESGSFKEARFASWLGMQHIKWPRLSSGRLCLDDETFKAMAHTHDSIGQVRELRRTLATMRNFDLRAGVDGRSRAALMPWQSKTGRNQPSTARFLFNLPSCMRGLLKPGPGRALAYVDWSQQEFGIAAALSGDPNMMIAYATGDPYLAFAKQAGAVPQDATEASHPAEREQFKACVLAVQYGMGDKSLA